MRNVEEWSLRTMAVPVVGLLLSFDRAPREAVALRQGQIEPLAAT
jgi:hypothetical protein